LRDRWPRNGCDRRNWDSWDSGVARAAPLA
jgi:hypothetical protein